MKKMAHIKVVLPLALVVFAMLPSLVYAQQERQTVNVDSRQSSNRQEEWLARSEAISRIHNNEEKLVRGAYAKLMRYQQAYVAETAEVNKLAARPQDNIEFELRNFHTGPIEEISDELYEDIVSPPTGEILTVAPSYRNQPNDPKFAVYIAHWTERNTSSADRSGMTIGEMLALASDHPTDVDFFASYEVTVRLAGKEKTYQAMALYRKAPQPGGRRRVEILDNITPAINAVLEEESPVVRVPWRTYVTSGSYFATVRSMKEARGKGVSPIAEDAPLGFLPGDDATPNDQDLQKSKVAAASVCQGCIVGGTPVTVTSLSPSEVHASTGDVASAHTLTMTFTPSYNILFNFPVAFLYNYGGMNQAVLTVPSTAQPSPLTATVKADSQGYSGVFVVHPECAGQVFPQQSIVIVPPQILLQMMRAEAGGLPSLDARLFIGWAIRNRFNDAMFGAPTSYYAAITCANCAAYNANLLTGQQPELDASASVFNGATGDPTYGSQGWWSPTFTQWQNVRSLLNSNPPTTDLPADRSVTGISFFYGGDRTRTQIVYFSSVGSSNTVDAPAFLFVRRRNPSDPAAVKLN